MLNVLVVMLVAAVAVLAGVVVVALGHGGELAYFPADYAPLPLEEVTSTDVALFRPPAALWGYSMQATDEALGRIAGAITERDIEIAALRQQVADLQWAPQRPASAPAQPPVRPQPADRPPDPSSTEWAALPPRRPADGPAGPGGDEQDGR